MFLRDQPMDECNRPRRNSQEHQPPENAGDDALELAESGKPIGATEMQMDVQTDQCCKHDAYGHMDPHPKPAA